MPEFQNLNELIKPKEPRHGGSDAKIKVVTSPTLLCFIQFIAGGAH